jgi:hypothetical protein
MLLLSEKIGHMSLVVTNKLITMNVVLFLLLSENDLLQCVYTSGLLNK